MPEDMPDKMPWDMPDRMPEDLPVTKRIDVMVGITRSKVIIWALAFQNRRFGNQKLQAEFGERKLISPKDSVLK